MEKEYIVNKNFERINYNENPLPKGEYENCNFLHCNFAESNLSGLVFSECNFISCNLSLAKLNKTAFKLVQFKDCKLLGLHFETCNNFLFSVNFENCTLNLSSFYKLKLKQTIFKQVSLQEVDFSECDLSEAKFIECNLHLATFDRTVLEKADLVTSFNYNIDPEINRIKKAKFSLNGLPGLLNRYEIDIE